MPRHGGWPTDRRPRPPARRRAAWLQRHVCIRCCAWRPDRLQAEPRRPSSSSPGCRVEKRRGAAPLRAAPPRCHLDAARLAASSATHRSSRCHRARSRCILATPTLLPGPSPDPISEPVPRYTMSPRVCCCPCGEVVRAAALADGGRRARCPRVLEGHGPEVRSLAAAVRVLRVSRRRRSAWAASRRTAATPSLRRGSAWLLWLASGCSMDGGRPTRSTGCFSPSMSGSAVGGEG